MKEYQLGDLLDKIVGGGTPSKSNSDYWNGEIPWASVKDMSDDRYRLKDTADYISEVGLRNSSSNLIPAGTVITSTRMGLGRCFINDVDMAINQDLKALFPKKSLDKKFLLWWLASKATELESIGTGTTVKGIRLDQLRAQMVLLPSLQEQQKIASILSVFDDLIENNTRRIAILEEMARLIYNEWFLNYRYPGHENDRLVSSGTEIGEVPEGWEVINFGDLVDYIRDSVKNEDVDEEVPVLGLGDMPKESICLSEWVTTSDIGSTKLKFKRNDILFGKIRPYFHKVGFAQIDGVSSSDIFIWRPKNQRDFVLALLTASSEVFVETATNSSSGTKMPRAKWDVLENYRVAYPTAEILEKLNSLTAESLNQIRTLSFWNKRLKETRDLLLPKLISGKIILDKNLVN